VSAGTQLARRVLSVAGRLVVAVGHVLVRLGRLVGRTASLVRHETGPTMAVLRADDPPGDDRDLLWIGRRALLSAIPLIVFLAVRSVQVGGTSLLDVLLVLSLGLFLVVTGQAVTKVRAARTP